MQENNDDIKINIIDEPNSKKGSKKSKSKNSNKKNNNNSLSIQAKILGILFMLFSVLLLLALVSYTPRDEANAHVSFSELSGLFSPDSEIRIKADTTHNWLGLFGAVISNMLINGTIGYAIIILPYFLFRWGLSIYSKIEVEDKIIKSTSYFLILATLFSSLMGALFHFSIFNDFSRSWSGTIGLFLGTMLSKLLSPFGAFLVYTALIIIAILAGNRLKISRALVNLIHHTPKFFNWLISKLKIAFSKVKEFKDKEIEESKKQSKAEEIDNTESITEDMQQSEESLPDFKDTSISIEPIIDTKPKQDVPVLIRRNNDKQEKVALDVPITPSIKPKISISQHKIEEPSPQEAIPVFRPKTIKNPEEEVFVSFKENEPTQKNEKNQTTNIDQIEKIEVEENQNTINRDEKNKEEKIDINFHYLDDVEEDDEVDINQVIQKVNSEKRMPAIEPPPPEILPNVPVDLEVSSERISRKAVVVTVNERQPDEDVFRNPLGVDIHDENIKFKPLGLELLDNRMDETDVDSAELEMNARILQEKLETFKIYIEGLTVTPGPVVTQYEFVPAPGIKISRIESLADDLAMALKAKGIRIIAPIPGKGTIGIEIPNSNRSLVRFANVVNTSKFVNNTSKLPMCLGKTISGEVYIADLAKMPHLLIAGSTGAGKSVGVNTIINSLLYKLHPSELKFVIVDPKKVELQQYSRLKYHYMALSPDVEDTIVTNPQDAVVILKSVVLEMENRYNILAKVGQRNISDYNDKVKAGAYHKITDFDHRPMPYIVVIIDELADLMLTASKEVEEPIIRLAQMARAVGIHLIIATQRPSVDVITGIIKANFPARIAYLVASKIDSRTILDSSGAEQLLGYGDMLFLPSGSPKPIRIQNAFISTDEVENICDFIGNQRGYSQPYMLPSVIEKKNGMGSVNASDRDPLFEDAARIVIQIQQASVSLLQRRLKVGYARAGRIVDELEDAGIIGPNEGSKARIVLLDSEAQLEAYL